MTASARLGAVLVGSFLAVALAAPLLAPFDPAQPNLPENLSPPSLAHPFGQDRLGRDILSRVVYGSRASLLVGISTVAVSLTLGTALGLFSGLAGGWIDEAVMRAIDVVLAFPGILLAIAISAVLGPSLANVVIALSVIGWTGYARLVRAETLSLRERAHVESAIALGAGPSRVVLCHVLPLLAGPLAVQATFGCRRCDRRRGEPLLPRPRDAAARAVLGRDAERGQALSAGCAARRAVPRPRRVRDGSRHQLPRRWATRLARRANAGHRLSAAASRKRLR